MQSPSLQPGRLGWYVRRLASMTPGEMVWRGGRLVGGWVPQPDLTTRSSSRLLRRDVGWEAATEAFRAAVGRPLLLDRSRAQTIAVRHPDEVAALVAAAERVRAGYVTYFGYPEAQLTDPVDWNDDPLRPFRWPSRDAARIDHRVTEADPKWIWELNRLQHLPWLAQAWLFTGDDGYAELAFAHLDTWLDQNPVGHGIAWRGAFEAGVRAVSVAAALQGLRDSEALTTARFERVVRMLAASADLCWRDRSRFSSANNHAVGELAGLATIALLLPELALARSWEQRALAALSVEAGRQILPDGAGSEQAVGYQVFTAELMLVVAALLRSRGDAPPAALLAAIDRSADYLAAVVGDHDPDPRYGDDDEGFALRLGPEPLRTVRDHLGTVAALTGNEQAHRVGTPSLTAVWVQAAAGTSERPRRPDEDRAPVSLVAPQGGLAVLRSDGRRLTVDIGPLGYLSIAAHGHADALALTVSVDGADLVGDPGTASYYGHPAWRAVHRGTRVHPTVTVDDTDQSVPGGPFMWTSHARVQVNTVDLDRGVVDAQHDGYARLPGPVTHRRWVFAPPGEGTTILVVDEVSGSGEHEVRVSWPLHPSVDVVQQPPHGRLLTRDGQTVAQLVIAASAELEIDQVRGDSDRHLGWWSGRLEARTPSWLVGGVVRGRVPLVLASLIQVRADAGAELTEPAVSQIGREITVSWCAAGERHTAVIDPERQGSIEFRSVPTRRVGPH